MMPAHDVRVAILESINVQCDGYVDRDILYSAAWKPISGGSINQAYRIDMGLKSFFVKLNQVQYISMFEAEAAGLQVLRKAASIRVPMVYVCACDKRSSWLVMEYISLVSHSRTSEAVFARQLASMHSYMGESFGWFRNNTIGSTAQINTQSKDWQSFYGEQRLGYQLELAKNNGFGTPLQYKGERLMADLHVFFSAYDVQPSLLHGDLWSGNYAVDSDGSPVIYDPAVYYGDHEADIAMTELFGGLSDDFYAAYDEVYPLDADYAVRKILYHLYHILNHANLFAGSYVRQAEYMMDQLLAEC